MSQLTQERLRALLHYDPETGVFVRIKGVRGFARGSNAGTFHVSSGYVYIGVDRRSYRAHRLAYLYMTGEWPADVIDHVNGRRDDNRWDNIRDATRSQNNANAARRANNSSGAKGVSWDGPNKRWRAYIVEGGKQKHLGRFEDFEAARQAYADAARETFGEFARA